jgi:hypothetical protein
MVFIRGAAEAISLKIYSGRVPETVQVGFEEDCFTAGRNQGAFCRLNGSRPCVRNDTSPFSLRTFVLTRSPWLSGSADQKVAPFVNCQRMKERIERMKNKHAARSDLASEKEIVESDDPETRHRSFCSRNPYTTHRNGLAPGASQSGVLLTESVPLKARRFPSWYTFQTTTNHHLQTRICL